MGSSDKKDRPWLDGLAGRVRHTEQLAVPQCALGSPLATRCSLHCDGLAVGDEDSRWRLRRASMRSDSPCGA